MLFTLFESDIIIFRVQPKERIDLSKSTIAPETAFNSSMTD